MSRVYLLKLKLAINISMELALLCFPRQEPLYPSVLSIKRNSKSFYLCI